MNNKPLRTRHWLLGTALAATVAATLWASQSEEDVAVQPVAGKSRTPQGQAPAKSVATTEPLAAVSWNPVRREPWATPPDTQFAAWAPPPPPRVVAQPPPPPPPPMAPAFPYQLIGRMVDGEQTLALLAGPTRSLAVRAGELIDGQWKVDQINTSGLAVTWQPAQLKQTIAFRPTP